MVPFEKEVALIKNEKIRETLNKVLCHMPKWFMKEGASSTGKYHPDYAQGEGGLYRHTCAAVKIANELLKLDMYDYFTPDQKDYIICALILHDMCKYGKEDTKTKFTRFDHPLLVKEWLEEMGEDVAPREFIDMVDGFVSTHMGQWNTSKYQPHIVLPIPQYDSQKFVHLCDYLASRQFLEVKFDD